MSKLKSFVSITLFVIVAIVIESFREETGIPVTILDLILFPLILVFNFYLLRAVLFAKDRLINRENIQSLSLPGNIGIFAAFLLMLLLGVWALWAGIREPMGYFSGVKGAAHGYTLIAMGVLMVTFGIIGMWGVINTLLTKRFR